jgi:hypothetical protein
MNVNSPAVQISGLLLGGGLGFQALGRFVAHPKISRQRFRVLQEAVRHRDVTLLHHAVRLEQFRFIFLQKLFDRFIWQPQSQINQRFVLERKSAKEFVISYDTRKPQADWSTMDRLSCKQK